MGKLKISGKVKEKEAQAIFRSKSLQNPYKKGNFR
jgi:hypothetical protein